MKKVINLLIVVLICNFLFFNCSKEDSAIVLPPSNAVIGVKATLTTTLASNIGSVSAESGGIITNDGGSTITARGVVWSTNQYPTTAYANTIDGSGIGTFTSAITGLTPNTIYYARAYATNSAGTAYGNQITFSSTNSPVIPTVTTTAVYSITQATATSGGNVTSTGGAQVTARGVVWSTSPGPTTANSKTVDGLGTYLYTSSITGLLANTVYYVRAYATNSVGTAYGAEVTFTAGSIAVAPSISTTVLSAIAATVASSGGTISSEGGAPVTARGVVWSTNQNPSLANSSTVDGTGSGTFTSSITGLTPLTTYYVKAYATNSVGTTYGNQRTFTTPDIPVYTVGSIGPAGGYVFFVSNGHGLEVAPVSTQVNAQWGCPISNISGTTATIGTGLANTNIILQYHTSIGYYANPIQCQETVPVTGDVAAKVCDDLVFNGFSDWYLPSSDELQLIYTNLKTQGLGDFSTTNILSSSTQSTVNTRQFNVFDFTNGSIWGDWKYDIAPIRAIRSF